MRAYRLSHHRGLRFHRLVPHGRSCRAGGGTRHVIDPTVACERETERAKLATRIDAELRAACRTEAAVRRALGDAARALIARRGYLRLGFVRLADYARERLGVSARTVESAAWLATRLEALPCVAAALDRSEITWTQARAIARVAAEHDQEAWLARARTLTAVGLEDLTRASVAAAGFPLRPDEDDDEIDGEPTTHVRLPCPARVRALWRRAAELASRAAGEPLAAWRAAEIIAAEAFAGRPAGASFGDRMLSTAMRLARRVRRLGARTGEPAAVDRADAAPPGGPTDASTGSLHVTATRSSASGATAPVANDAPAESLCDATPVAPASDVRVDPFALDARLLDAITALRTSEPNIGRLLRLLVDHRLHRALGCRSLDEYVRERLGISTRKAWALLKVERRARSIAPFAKSYEDGRLSWVRALALLPVITPEKAEPWLTRATGVTVRRLVDEVNWVLETRDVLGPDTPLDPPPVASKLVSVSADASDGMALPDDRSDVQAQLRPTDACVCRETSLERRLQIGAHATPADVAAPAVCECHKTSLASDRRLAAAEVPRALEVCDAEIAVTAPLSVAALLRDTLDAWSRDGEPRWTAFERVLRHVIAEWQRLPRHPDPVFARDGWRCTVPGCSSRRNLHDHHVHFRSRGGGNARGNRTTICAAHHLHGVHGGTVRVAGTAPDALAWDLGVRGDRPPLLRYFGETLLRASR